MAGNTSLHAANKAKQDEFYTQISDIEDELRHYKTQFRDKVIFCNCDDPYESNFFKYFALNFNALGLKKLIATCYNGSPILGNELTFGFDEPNPLPEKIAYKVEITEIKDMNNDGAVNLLDIQHIMRHINGVISKLKGNGDFRSPECIELLKQADIVVTNPPFSLFREYIAQLIEYHKKFLVIGNQNAITYKEIFPLLQTNQMWLGAKAGDMAFMVPDYYEPRATRYWQDERGQKWRSLGTICWFTNLDLAKRHEDIVLYRQYSEEAYPHYDNYSAIEVKKVSDIPCDYDGVMGVPITFMDKYNPDQFEIIGMGEDNGTGHSGGVWNGGSKSCLINGKAVFKRIFIRRKR